MNKEEFYAMEPDMRAERINKMLLDKSLNEVAKEIDIPPSSFSKEMTNGDFVYIKRENQYYKFIRDINDLKSNPTSDDTMLFISKNIETIKKMVALFKHHTPLILNERVYSKREKYTNKNLKMNDSIYSEFVSFCENNYPTYRMQDLVAHALLDFTQKYEKK